MTTLDLRAFACPLTWVKTRIALERLAPGELVEVWLPAGEPAREVPESAREDGHLVRAVEPLAARDGAVRVVLEKGDGGLA